MSPEAIYNHAELLASAIQVFVSVPVIKGDKKLHNIELLVCFYSVFPHKTVLSVQFCRIQCFSRKYLSCHGRNTHYIFLVFFMKSPYF